MKTNPKASVKTTPRNAHQTAEALPTVTVIGNVPLSLAARISEIHAKAIAASEGVRQIQNPDGDVSEAVRRTHPSGQKETES